MYRRFRLLAHLAESVCRGGMNQSFATTPACKKAAARLLCLLALSLTSWQSWASSAAALPPDAPPATASPSAPPDPVSEIYRQADTALLWSAFGLPKEVAFTAINLLSNASEHGLDPERYATATLYESIAQLDTPEALATFDRLLTAAVWSYNEDMRRGVEVNKRPKRKRGKRKSKGQISPEEAEKEEAEKQTISALAKAIKQDNLRNHFNALTPRFANYTQLQQALVTYRDYQLMDGWSKLPTDTRLKLGDEHPSVVLLRQRLALTDGLSEDAITSERFDMAVQAAVIRFQARHQLQADGEIGPATLAKLNISVEEKIRRLSLNLARLRALPAQLPGDYIQVNIPEFQLRLVLNHSQALQMGVVVGSKANPTPTMQDRLRHLVFNPYWYPTRKITVNEILPRLKRNPDYLKQSNFEMLERRSKTVLDASEVDWQAIVAREFPYRFRQTPGEKNSLGQVKFIFPNSQSIYLHDTPSKSLFNEPVRAFSHGCVRVEKPTELATHLMAWDRGWTETDVLADIDAAKRKLRKFKQEMDIYLLYQTAAVHGDQVVFFPDIYRHDRRYRNAPIQAPIVAALLRDSVLVKPASTVLASR